MEPLEAFESRTKINLVDVREPFEWDAGHIEGAVHIPVGELSDRIDELTLDGPVVAVCASGVRSQFAAAVLREKGFEAENLDGGLEAWDAAGYPLVRDDGSPGEFRHA